MSPGKWANAMVSFDQPLADDDDPGFIDWVTKIITGAVVTYLPAEVRIFKIDQWFDFRWMTFSGKTGGAVPVWNCKLTVPPFVANRIVEQWHYCSDESGGAYRYMGGGDNIHNRRSAVDNLRRYIRDLVPNSALFWFSGETFKSGQGCLMGYIPVENGFWPWYLSFIRNDAWKIKKRLRIHENTIRLLLEASVQQIAMG